MSHCIFWGWMLGSMTYHWNLWRSWMVQRQSFHSLSTDSQKKLHFSAGYSPVPPSNSSIIPSGNHGRGWKTANFVNRRRALRLSAPSWCLIPALVGHYPGPGTVQPRFAGFGGLQGPEKYMKFTYRTIPWIMDWTSKIMETRWCPRYLFIGYQWPWGSVACWSSWTLPAVAHQVTGNNKLETHQNKFHLVSSSSITFVLFRFWHIHQQRMSRSCLLRNMQITCRCRDHAKCDYMFEDGWWYYVLGMVYL